MEMVIIDTDQQQHISEILDRLRERCPNVDARAVGASFADAQL